MNLIKGMIYLKILVVDDTRLNLAFAESIIKKSNLDVELILVGNGMAALEAISKNEINIIILDIVMPGMTGIEVLKKIRSNQDNDNIRILMFTSINDKEILRECLENGATDYINKPIDEIEFISRIKVAIRECKYQNKIKDTQFFIIQKEKLVAIGELAAGIAHEINNPVGYVQSNVQTLKKYVDIIRNLSKEYEILINDFFVESTIEKIQRVLSEEEKEIITKLQNMDVQKERMKYDFIISDLDELFKESFDGLDRVTEIVQSLKNFARQDKINLIKPEDITKIMDETLIIAKNESKYYVDIYKEYEENLPEVGCIRNQIVQVFLNIIINAIQAIKTQGKSEKGNLYIKIYKDQDNIVCSIKDDGPGIGDSIKSNIFDPFFTTKDVGEGTGLGLSISYDLIVNKHKGEIILNTELGKGTNFIIKIPILTKSDN
ncbi:MAG TPA: hybrid sensor histidine kinase/response regulator [Clostridiales bacterium]|nr:hybrid sensor histidine kinase/response regulator [Clostridiales bacterium]